MSKFRVLRPLRKASLVSAEVFERIFQENLSSIMDLRTEPLVQWCQAVLGPADRPFPLSRSASIFKDLVKKFDFFCPGYELLPLSPLFLALRNLSGSRIRLLFIAHAPGVYVNQWVLLRPLLMPGDLIIAPSRSAGEVIELLVPELRPWIRVIHHPMSPYPSLLGRQEAKIKTKRIVSLSRIEQSKLIHRQIDALDLLAGQGRQDLVMDIAGPLTDPGENRLTPYAAALKSRIRRLGLENQVFLTGTVADGRAKEDFLRGAQAMAALSITREEAFPKTSVEALGAGIPVVATRWNGFVETVGQCGRLVKTVESRPRGRLDVNPGEVARALEQVLEHPPSREVCLEHFQKFTASEIRRQYAHELEQAMSRFQKDWKPCLTPAHTSAAAAPARGVLARSALLLPFSWQEIFCFFETFAHQVRMTWTGRETSLPVPGAMMQDYLCISTRKPVEKLMSGRGADQSRQSELTEDYDVHPGETLDQYGFARRLLDGMRISSCQSSREACLFIFRGMHRLDMLEKGMKMLKKEGRGSPGLDYLEVELKVMRGDFSGAYKDIILQYRQTPPGELDGFRVRQLAAAARKWGRAEKAFDLIRKWTDKYPDGPDSPAVWLDLCLCALDMPDSHLKTAGNALSRCRELLGEQQLVRDLEVKYQARLAAAW